MFKKSDMEIVEAFYKLQTGQDVADMLEINFKSLRYFAYGKNNKYMQFEIPKKKGGVRKISAPVKELKCLQKKMAYILEKVYEPKMSANGFIAGKSIKTNSINHVKQRNLLNIDLKDFFSQIHFGRIKGMLVNKPYQVGEEAARYIAQLACDKSILPQGAPSSPVITNMICKPLDNQLMSLAKKYNCIYSRYADDITFSTYSTRFNEDIVIKDEKSDKVIIGKELKKIIIRNGFDVNDDKTFFNSYITRQEVTGVIVNKKINVKREYIKNIRAILNKCEKDSIYETAKVYIKKGLCKNSNIEKNVNNANYKKIIIEWFKEVLKGKLNHIAFIRGRNDKIFLKYAEQFNKICEEEIFDIEKQKELNDILENVVIIESQDEDRQGSGFLLKNYGIITSYHVTEDNNFYNVYKYDSYKKEKYTIISNEINCLSGDYLIDYAIYENRKDGRYLELGDSNKLKIGDEVTIIGYPNFQKGDSYNIQKRRISGIKNFLGNILYTVDGTICHGASGGVVLDIFNKVVGIVKAGVENMETDENTVNQGFIPMHLVLEHYIQTKK